MRIAGFWLLAVLGEVSAEGAGQWRVDPHPIATLFFTSWLHVTAIIFAVMAGNESQK